MIVRLLKITLPNSFALMLLAIVASSINFVDLQEHLNSWKVVGGIQLMIVLMWPVNVAGSVTRIDVRGMCCNHLGDRH